MPSWLVALLVEELHAACRTPPRETTGSIYLRTRDRLVPCVGLLGTLTPGLPDETERRISKVGQQTRLNLLSNCFSERTFSISVPVCGVMNRVFTKPASTTYLIPSSSSVMSCVSAYSRHGMGGSPLTHRTPSPRSPRCWWTARTCAPQAAAERIRAVARPQA